MSNHDYPDDDEIRRITDWEPNDPAGWLDFIRSRWWAADWGWESFDGKDDLGHPITVHFVSTGGWSGNEERICAMRGNWRMWMETWQQHRRGGHYRFHVRPTETAEARERGEGEK